MKTPVGLSDVVNYFGLLRGACVFVLTLACAAIFAPAPDAVMFALPLIMLLGWTGADVINNAYDHGIDKITNPERDRMYSLLGPSGSLGVGVFFLLCSAVLTVWTGSLLAALVVLFALALTFLYSVPPFRVRDTLYKPVCNGLIGACTALLPAVYYSNYPPAFFALLFVNGLGVAIITIGEDVKDWAGDKKARAKTMPVLLGPKGSLKVIIPLYFAFYAGILATGYLLGLHALFFPASLLAMAVHSWFNWQWSKDLDRNPASRKKFSDAIIAFGLAEACFLLVFFVLR